VLIDLQVVPDQFWGRLMHGSVNEDVPPFGIFKESKKCNNT